MALPVGYRFSPTDEELVRYYLEKKVKGEQVPSNAVINMDVYNHDPSSLWYHHDMQNGEDRYYFVERKKKSEAGKGTNPKRTVEGRGWWNCNNSKSLFDKLGNVIGSMTSLTYFEFYNTSNGGTSTRGTKTDWIMHEYKLNQNKFQDWVLCRIRDGTKRKKNKLYKVTNNSQLQRISPMNQGDEHPSTGGYSRSHDRLLPVGFRFEPTDEELTSTYLKKKYTGDQLPSNAVIDKDIYGCEPWFFLSEECMGNVNNDGRDLYYFVNRQKKFCNSEKGKRPNREVKGKFGVGGFWQASNGDCVRNSHDHVIGYVQNLTFFRYKNMNRSRKECIKTDWVMHEFSLSRETFQKWVLCHIRNNSKRSKEEANYQMKNEGSDENFSSTCENQGILSNTEMVNSDHQQQQQQHFANMLMQQLPEKWDIGTTNTNTTCDEEGQSNMELFEEYLHWKKLINDEEQQELSANSISEQEIQVKMEELKPCITCGEERKSGTKSETAYLKDGQNQELKSTVTCDEQVKTTNFNHVDLSFLDDEEFTWLEDKNIVCPTNDYSSLLDLIYFSDED